MHRLPNWHQTDAGDPQKAEELYEYMIEKAKEQVPVVETGILEQI